MTKQRDYAYEALAEVTATDINEGRGELNKALKSIREQTGIEDSFALSIEIVERAKLYRGVMEDVMLTPSSLAKHWKRVEEEMRTRSRSKATNQHSSASDKCETCGGDRFVAVGTRPIETTRYHRDRGLEPKGEDDIVAPCPDCNPRIVRFRRADGTLVATPDPERVREMMTR